MKNLIFLIIVLVCACEQKQTLTTSKPRGVMMQRDTLLGIKGCDMAQFEETKVGNIFNYGHTKVLTIPSEDGVGEEIYVQSTHQKDTFWIENIEAYHFFGIKNDLLFVDNGTGPNGRSFLVYDLATRKMIHEDHYEAEISIKNNKIMYLTPIDTRNIRLRASVCPNSEKWEKQGLGVGYAQIISFDLKTKESEETGEYSCFPIQ